MKILYLVDSLILEGKIDILFNLLKTLPKLFRTEIDNAIPASAKSLDDLIKVKGNVYKGPLSDLIDRYINPKTTANVDVFKAQVLDRLNRLGSAIQEPDKSFKRGDVIDHIKDELTQFMQSKRDLPTDAYPKIMANDPAWNPVVPQVHSSFAHNLNSVVSRAAGSRYARPEIVNMITDHPGATAGIATGVTGTGIGVPYVVSKLKEEHNHTHTNVFNPETGKELIDPVSRGQQIIYADPKTIIPKSIDHSMITNSGVIPKTPNPVMYVDPKTNTEFTPITQDHILNTVIGLGAAGLGSYGLYKYLKHKHRNDGID